MITLDERKAAFLDFSTVRADLEVALVREEFSLMYQPVFSLERRAPVGAEALLRWDHPQWDALSPRIFLPVADEVGMTDAVTEAVLKLTCSQSVEWHAACGIEMHLSINVSRQQLVSPRFVCIVAEALRTTGAKAGRLILEVDEKTLWWMDPAMRENLHDVADLGVKVAIDDFGSARGPSAELRWFPIHVLKVNARLITDATNDRYSGAVLRSMTAFGEELEMPVVAKGVETREQFGWLRECGIDLVQGFAVSQALQPTDLYTWCSECLTHAGD